MGINGRRRDHAETVVVASETWYVPDALGHVRPGLLGSSALDSAQLVLNGSGG